MKKIALSCLFIVVACGGLFVPDMAVAATSLNGGQTITIESSFSECVVPSKSLVSITMTSVRVPSNKPWPAWLKNTKAFGVKVDLSVDGPSGTGKHASFPVAKMVTQIKRDNSAPIIRATLNIPLLTKYRLFDGDGNFAHIDMPLTLVRIDDNKNLRALMDALSSVTEAVKFPASPFEPGVQAFGNLVKSLFTTEADPSEDYPNAILGFELVDDVSECSANSQALRTGAHAQIFSGPSGAPGIVGIDEYAKYCYYSSDGADPNILYAPRTGGACPMKVPAIASALNNPQIIFVVNSYPISLIQRPAVAEVDSGTLQALQEVVSTVRPADFAAFSKSIDLSDHGLDFEDLKALKAKVNTALPADTDRVFNLNMTPVDRAAFTASGALVNCKLVGLDSRQCD